MSSDLQPSRQRILTGITTTGIPHLGNYVGAIRPAVQASLAQNVDSFLFLANYHGLIKCDDPERIRRSSLEVAVAWLAAGLDPARTYFYRQSDVPETLELYWLITCVAAKGLMNRAHAYKASTDANTAAGEDEDAGVTMGLFSYPVLMAADILLFGAHQVPVGRDQVQHIEMTRDIAQRFNQLYGGGRELLTLPQAVVSEQPVLPGLDGRKMSKSYDNTVPLFAGGRKTLKTTVARIVTDSRLPGDPKDPEANPILALYGAFASPVATAAFRAELEAGLAWGEAKARLVDCIEAELAPLRDRYDALMAKPADVEDILQAGAAKARTLAGPLLAELRDAVGLSSFARLVPAAPPTQDSAGARPSGAGSGPASGTSKTKGPTVRQFREADGSMHFKLTDKNAGVLLEGGPFASGAEAGAAIQALRSAVPAHGDASAAAGFLPAGVRLADGVSLDVVLPALLVWREA